MNNPVVITGIGILSPLGIGVAECAAALREGESAVQPCSRFAPPTGCSPLCGEVPPFRVEEYLQAPKAYLDRNSELLLAAAGMALRQAGVESTRLVPERAGILVGTAWGGQETMAAFFADYVQKGARLVKPVLFPHTYFNTAVSLAAMEWSLRGVHQSFASGRLAAGQALVEACDLLADDEAELILAGGCEALGPALFRTLAALGALRPQDGGAASGIVPGEAGVMLVLERQEAAARRGAPVLATVLGTGLSAAGGGSGGPALPGADGCGGSGGPALLPGAGGGDGAVGAPGGRAASAMHAALRQAGVAPADVAGLSLSANGCAAVEAAEADALRQVFGERSPDCLTSATLCGDTQGACAALQAALAILRGTGAPELVLTTDASGSAVALLLQTPSMR